MMKQITALILTLFISTGFMSNNKNEYQPSKGKQLLNTIVANTTKIIKDKYSLKPSGVGVAMPGGPIQEITLCFDTKYPYTKEQLRELLIKSSQELLNQVKDNDEIQEFLNERPFTIKNVEIIIFNHDKDGSVLKDPQISVARISQGQLIYRTNDPEDSFKYKNEFEETYEEALQAINK